MSQTIDLSRTVYDLTHDHPEVIEVLATLGFGDVTSNAVRHTVGRLMTIPKGAALKGIALQDVVAALETHGFHVIGIDTPTPNAPNVCAHSDDTWPPTSHEARVRRLETYLCRLNDGESLERVRSDFVHAFQHVDPNEIMLAEQALLRKGIPLADVKRLCDVHFALIGDAAQAPMSGAALEPPTNSSITPDAMANKHEKANALCATPGHPLWTLTKENEALATRLARAKACGDDRGALHACLREIQDVAHHYAKKGDLIYPLLKVTYGVTGPSEVMWTIDDEIRAEMSSLVRADERDDAWAERAQATLERIDAMIQKERTILFPICAVILTDDDWRAIERDVQDYTLAFDIPRVRLADGADEARIAPSCHDGAVMMTGGRMTLGELEAVLNTVPLELTFVDACDINRYVNEGPKVFKRPSMALGRDVFSCHPPAIESTVRTIIQSLRSGARDQVSVWMDKGGRPMLVSYLAVRDADGRYLGTLETVADMMAAKEHFAALGGAERSD